MKFKYSITLALVQIVLVVTSVIIDQSIHNGLGEGHNQVMANIVTNIEYFLKVGLGMSDIVNFKFIFATAILGVVFWFAVGVLIDYLFYRRAKS